MILLDENIYRQIHPSLKQDIVKQMSKASYRE